MELEWEFGTWVPLLSRLCPYDKYKIWKKGSWVRVDTTLIGFENLQWVRGNVSLLFKGTDESLKGHEGYGGSHLIIMDHKRQRVEFAMDSLKKYSIGNKKKDANVEDILSGDIMRVKLDVDDVRFSPAKTWMGYEKKELIKNLWSAKVFDISGLQRVTMKRVETRPIPRHTRRPPVEDPSIDAELYFKSKPDPSFPKGTGLLYPHEQLKVSRKKHSAKMWLSEDFPVTVQELLPLFAILAPSGKHFDKLESFLNMHMPDKGFPVKIGRDGTLSGAGTALTPLQRSLCFLQCQELSPLVSSTWTARSHRSSSKFLRTMMYSPATRVCSSPSAVRSSERKIASNWRRWRGS